MRIAQKAGVEHQVGLARQAAAVGERHHGDAQPAFGVRREMAQHQRLQLLRRQLRGVDGDIGMVAQRTPAAGARR